MMMRPKHQHGKQFQKSYHHLIFHRSFRKKFLTSKMKCRDYKCEFIMQQQNMVDDISYRMVPAKRYQHRQADIRRHTQHSVLPLTALCKHYTSRLGSVMPRGTCPNNVLINQTLPSSPHLSLYNTAFNKPIFVHSSIS